MILFVCGIVWHIALRRGLLTPYFSDVPTLLNLSSLYSLYLTHHSLFYFKTKAFMQNAPPHCESNQTLMDGGRNPIDFSQTYNFEGRKFSSNSSSSPTPPDIQYVVA